MKTVEPNVSDSMLTTQKDLVKVAGNSVWFTEFTPLRLDHLDFVKRLLHTFWELDICCALVNAYPAYIAGAVSVCSVGELTLSILYFAKVNSPLLDHFYLNDPYFQVGPFSFALRDSEEHDSNPDYYVYIITLGEETFTFLIGFIDTVTCVPCGCISSITFLEFLWDNTVVFSFQKYGIVCVPSIHLGSSTCVIMGLTARAGQSYANDLPDTINLKPPLSYTRALPLARASAMCVSVNPLHCEV